MDLNLFKYHAHPEQLAGWNRPYTATETYRGYPRHSDEYTETHRCLNGQLHCDDGPAITSDLGSEVWIKHGLHHRLDGPAIASPDGSFSWYKDGKQHRDGDKPATYDSGRHLRMWYKNGLLHRDGDKPAVIDPSVQQWFKHGEMHRENGPAVIWYEGGQPWRVHYYRNGVMLGKEFANKDGTFPTHFDPMRKPNMVDPRDPGRYGL